MRARLRLVEIARSAYTCFKCGGRSEAHFPLPPSELHVYTPRHGEAAYRPSQVAQCKSNTRNECFLLSMFGPLPSLLLLPNPYSAIEQLEQFVVVIGWKLIKSSYTQSETREECRGSVEGSCLLCAVVYI